MASRFYDARTELHAKLSDLARNLAFQVPARGYKSVEIVQAYLINVLWGCGPVQRYEQDQTWMLLGMAIRCVLPFLFDTCDAVADLGDDPYIVTESISHASRALPRFVSCAPMLTSSFTCRMATDLNLHRRSTGASPDTPEGRARDREVRNRERAWIICFCLDRSFSAQMGKPYSIKEECVRFGCYMRP